MSKITKIVTNPNGNSVEYNLKLTPYSQGIVVKAGLFYTDDENIWETKKIGTPINFEDSEHFNIIPV